MANPDVICLSHLRWNFVFQRPNHLMSRCAREARVFFVEEPHVDADEPRVDVVAIEPSLRVVTPHLRVGTSPEDAPFALRVLLDRFMVDHRIDDYLLWFYTPMAIELARHLAPRLVVYDCMDELSAFAGAPAGLRERELELFERADLVLTGGQSLYESKRAQHPNVHAFPSSVDAEHFRSARAPSNDPDDQASLARPRIGFFGVLDERLDLPLLEAIARARPAWQLVLIGPVVKIDPARLPRLPNVHYLGARHYSALPRYVGGWDVAIMPFARNDATRYISPTKTLEYMAAGKPIVSTSIRDVIRPYGDLGLVRVADDPSAFLSAIEAALVESPAARLAAFDAWLSRTSWDRTWDRMRALIDAAIRANSDALLRKRTQTEAG